MISWILIVIVLVVLILLFKYKEMRHKLGLTLAILLFLFVAVSVVHFYTNNTTDLSTFDGVVSAGKLYFSWLGSFASNIVKISGYAVNQDWSLGAKNASINNKLK